MPLVFQTACGSLPRTDPYGSLPPRGLSLFTTASRPNPPTKPSVAGQSLTLEQCIEVALQNNPELAATDWEVSAAGSRLDQARGARWPSLSMEGRADRFLDPQRLIQARYNGEPGSFDENVFRSDILLKLPLFTGGRILSEIEAAHLLHEAEGNRLMRTREELVFAVSSTFFSILGQRKVIESLKFSLAAMDEHLKQVGHLLDAQKAARVDVLRSEVRLADLKQSLVREENVLAVQKRLLANLLGLDYDTERFMPVGRLTFQEVALDADRLLEQALGQRPDYMAAQRRLEAQARRVDAARAGHMPTVSLQGGYGLRGNALGDGDDAGAIGVGVTVPLFEGARIAAKVEEERAALAASQERFRKLKLQIRQEVETAVLEIRANTARVQSVEKAIEQARESLRIERQKYRLGMGSLTDVLDAQSALLQAETSYHRAMADYRIAMARLDLATGGHPL